MRTASVQGGVNQLEMSKVATYRTFGLPSNYRDPYLSLPARVHLVVVVVMCHQNIGAPILKDARLNYRQTELGSVTRMLFQGELHGCMGLLGC